MDKDLMNEDLLKELGIDKLSSEKAEEMMATIGRILYQAVLIRVMERLTDGEKEEFGALLDRGADEESVLAFLTTKVPDLNSIVDEEVAKFKAESLSVLRRDAP
jgi:hypothetical protein